MELFSGKILNAIFSQFSVNNNCFSIFSPGPFQLPSSLLTRYQSDSSDLFACSTEVP